MTVYKKMYNPNGLTLDTIPQLKGHAKGVIGVMYAYDIPLAYTYCPHEDRLCIVTSNSEQSYSHLTMALTAAGIKQRTLEEVRKLCGINKPFNRTLHPPLSWRSLKLMELTLHSRIEDCIDDDPAETLEALCKISDDYFDSLPDKVAHRTLTKKAKKDR